MSDGRSHVFPQKIGFGARPLAVPGRGNVLCASAILTFRLSDGEIKTVADWYKTVANAVGANAIPDATAPVPGAEVIVFGALDAVAGDRREAFLSCGELRRRFLLYPDPENPAAPFLPGPEAAAWHEEDNPLGRGGPEDDRRPLIVAAEDPDTPIWLGATPFDHPLRRRRAGEPDLESGIGWPKDADPAVLCESHPGFWLERLQPGAPLAFAGLAGADIETHLPPYRVSVAYGYSDGKSEDNTGWDITPTRIHCVTLIPGADLAAVIYRSSIPVGDDILGEQIGALVAALEDADAEEKDAEHWSRIALERWDDPVKAMDDRPLLPKALAAMVTLPFATPEADPMAERHAAAAAWAREEAGMPENPFSMPDDIAEMTEEMQDEADGKGDAAPDADAITVMANAALAAGKRRHEQAGFETPEVDAEAPREPEERGAQLDAEMNRRLRKPYATPLETSLAERMRGANVAALKPDETLEKIAEARAMNPHPPMPWPALDETEGERFGERIAQQLKGEDVQRHIDISSARIVGDEQRIEIIGRRIDGLLAEETTWRGVDFIDCEITGGSFAAATFEDCTFATCTLEKVNLSRATLTGCQMKDCKLRSLQLMEPVWIDCRFDRCELEQVALTDSAVRDLAFTEGAWREVDWTEGLMVRVALRRIEMDQVSYMLTHAPENRFEGVSMHKVYAMTKGFPGSVFEEVQGKMCGFVGPCHFVECRFERVQFTDTGFTNAIFKDAHIAPGCQFTNCDFGGGVFMNTALAGARFVQCNMVTSIWMEGSRAAEAWFFGALLRGVDFADTDLTRAVFTDADLEDVKFLPDKTIGADFRGTVLGIGKG